MRYSKYLKDLGISYTDYFKLKYFNALLQYPEILKYGTNCHEMWSLDIILAFEIYPRLKRLHEKYYYVCNFSDSRLTKDMSNPENFNKYEKASKERFDKVLYAFETLIKTWRYPELEEYPPDMFDNPDSQYNRVKEGFKIFGEGFWGLGI